jgi:hypothetical protein
MSREAFEGMKRRAMEHAQKTGKPITERQADKLIRPAVERAERERQGVTANYRGGERQ